MSTHAGWLLYSYISTNLCALQAFSGIKSTETQRQKKEARLQGELLNWMSAVSSVCSLARQSSSSCLGFRGKMELKMARTHPRVPLMLGVLERAVDTLSGSLLVAHTAIVHCSVASASIPASAI